MPKKYGKGTLKPLPNGKCDAYISIAGKVLRKRLSSVHEAKAWLDAQDAHSVADLTAIQIKDAATALAMLPAGVSLSQAAQHYLATSSRSNPSQPIVPLLEAYIASISKRLRSETIRSYRQLLNRAVADLGTDIAEYTETNIRRKLDHHTDYNYNHIIRALCTFFNWAIDLGHLQNNPCVKIKQRKVAETEIHILTLEQAEHLLHACYQRYKPLIPYFVLCLFAGLRPTEAKRVTSAAFGEEYITLTSKTTKTASARTIPLEEGMRYILERFPLGKRAHSTITCVLRSSNIPWHPDIMRHSYGSYAYERSRSASSTAYNMGHQGTDVFFRHYRGLVAPGDGEKYFKILSDFSRFLQQNE